MEFKKTNLSNAYIINLKTNEDDRGYFSRLFCQNKLKKIGLNKKILQVNHSFTKNKGTLRGLHFQYPPKAEIKIIKCINGEVWDVIVDLRKKSKTYGKSFSIKLTSKSQQMIFIPEGFAHGFITLQNNCEILYFVTEYFSKKFEGTLRWNDDFHNIKWPIKPKIISDKDKCAPDWENNKAI
tara:strand:- start:2847 stop:3389 length:543 start_codon:yes stop_codon:yes gene_type:complete